MTMPRLLTTLHADRTLTKTFHKDGRSEPYPLVRDFTSLVVAYSTIEEMLEVIVATAEAGGCLLKGHLTKQLDNESRAGHGDATANTDWLVLDYDSDGGFDSIPDLLDEIDPELNSVDYIFQHSASSGITGDAGIRGHIFFLLTDPVAPSVLKQWVRKINLVSEKFRNRVKLSRNAMALCYALDPTVNQNDKLIYVAPPTIIGMKDPINQRFELFRRDKRTYTFTASISAEYNRAKEIELLNTLQDQLGIPKRTPKYTTVGDTELLSNPGECTVTGVKKSDVYTRINLNGGDSWAYWHYTDNPEILYNYKGEPATYLKDIAPTYYQQLQLAEERKTIRPFVFRDVMRDAFYNAEYDETNGHIVMCQAVSRRQTLADFMIQRGSPAPKVIPDWEMKFDPTDKLTVDFQNRRLNTFAPSIYMRMQPEGSISDDAFPTIKKILGHICVTPEVYNHFLRWIAHIMQFRTKTQTAWLFSGVEGCLSGDTVVGIARGKRCSASDRPRTLEYIYNRWAGIKGRAYDRSIHPTRMMACKDELTVGLHEVHDIYQSGIKPVWQLTTISGNTIKATAEHPFMRPDKSMTKLKDLKPGDAVLMQGDRRQHRNGCGKGRNKARKTIHSVQHHPHAWRHVIGGKNYKRIHYSRLIYEAAMNGISVEHMIDIVRNHPDKAKQLVYLPANEIIHHVDENPSNDALENLVAIDKENHDRHHAKHTGLGTHVAVIDVVANIEYVGEEMTYDITMKAPYHNYVANGFIVSNTGKGVMFTHIMKPLLGDRYCQIVNQDNLEDQFNGYVENNLLLFVDEGDIESSKAAEKVMGKLRTTITEKTLPIRQMRQNMIEVPNFTNVIVATNRSMAVKLQQSDRRWNIAPRQNTKIVLSYEEIHNDIPQELAAFAQHLLALPIEITDALTLIETDSRDHLLELSRTVADEFFMAIKTGDLDFFAERLQDTVPVPENGYIAFASIIQKWMQAAVDQEELEIIVDDIVSVYRYISGNSDITSKRFGHLASRHEIHAKQKRIRGIQRRVFTVKFEDRGYAIWLHRNKKAGVQKMNLPHGVDKEVSENG